MRTVGLAILIGVTLGAGVDLLSTSGPVDMRALLRVIGISAAKSAFIGWLVPRSMPWLSLALATGVLMGMFFWSTVPNRGEYPDIWHWWNLFPGAVLGFILILLEWRKPARVATRERNQQAS